MKLTSLSGGSAPAPRSGRAGGFALAAMGAKRCGRARRPAEPLRSRAATLLFALVLACTAGAASVRAAETNAAPFAAMTNVVQEGAAPPAVSLWFPVGEEVVYKIYWGMIPVGKTRITTRWVQQGGHTLLAIRYRTKSNRVIATLYPVNDTIETLIEPTTFLPVRFEKRLSEGRRRQHEITIFDYQALKAHWWSVLKNKQKTFDIEPDTRDLVSFMYYMRSQTFREGVESHYRVMADDKTYDLYLKAAAVESVKLDGYGRVRSMRVEPQAKFEGLFVRKGKMTVWVSRDARSLCTQVKAEVPVASVRVVLTNVNGPGDDQWVKRSPKEEADEDDPVDLAGGSHAEIAENAEFRQNR